MKTFDRFKADLAAGLFTEAINKKLSGCKEPSPEKKMQLLIELARENGYEVSTEDLALANADERELDENELQNINGGFADSCWENNYCVILVNV